MTSHQELSKLRKDDVSLRLSNTLCQKHIDWLKKAKTRGVNWQKLEMFALSEKPRASKAPALSFKKGTKLLREYQGKTHQVLTTSEGFLYNDVAYKSLTAIANKITGKKWNGNLFFNVRRT